MEVRERSHMLAQNIMICLVAHSCVYRERRRHPRATEIVSVCLVASRWRKSPKKK